MLTVCFTGHRPNRLFGYDWNTRGNQEIIKSLYNTVNTIVSSCDDTIRFICGGALGIDQQAFSVVDSIREKHPEKIWLVLALPYSSFSSNWFDIDTIERHVKHIKLADEIVYVDKLPEYKVPHTTVGEYNVKKLQKRNEYMVDNSDIVIAVWDGVKNGGTYNCIRHAVKNNKQIIQIKIDRR